MRRHRNPSYAPESLERKLNPSGIVAVPVAAEIHIAEKANATREAAPNLHPTSTPAMALNVTPKGTNPTTPTPTGPTPPPSDGTPPITGPIIPTGPNDPVGK